MLSLNCGPPILIRLPLTTFVYLHRKPLIGFCLPKLPVFRIVVCSIRIVNALAVLQLFEMNVFFKYNLLSQQSGLHSFE